MLGEPKELIVVIVDDDALVRGLLIRIVSIVPGVKAMVACTAEEGLALASGNPVSLVITDMNMPGETGAWLLKQLRARGNTVPVILHSGSLEQEEEPRILELGATCVVRKPAPPSVILKAILDCLH